MMWTVLCILVPLGPLRGGSARKGYVFQAAGIKRVGISQVEVYIRVGNRNRSFRCLKGPLLIIFRLDAPEGCRSSFIKHYMKTRTRFPKIGM